MSTAHFFRKCRFRVVATMTGLLTVPVLAAGCAGEVSGARSGDGDSSGSGLESAAAARPVVDAACPQRLSADDLTESVDYPSADLDGDGEADSISLGMVPGGGAACPAALVVSTADGTAAAAVTGLQAVPPRGSVPGGAATVGADQVIAAPVSWSLRGGGEVGLFTLMDGVLTPVVGGSGRPWTVVATVDDGGGTPQSIDCAGDGLTHAEATSDGLGGPVHVHAVHYTLDGAQLTKESSSSSTSDNGDPARGLHVFASC